MTRFITLVGILAVLILAGTAQAQEVHPDVDLACSGNTCAVGCHTPLDTDLSLACFVRTDVTRNIDLGCIEAPAPDTSYYSDFWVSKTVNTAPELRCYVIDTEGLKSELSANKGTSSFVKPGRGHLK